MTHENEPLTGLDAAIERWRRGGIQDRQDYERRQHETHASLQTALDQRRAEAISHFYGEAGSYYDMHADIIRSACAEATRDYQRRNRRSSNAIYPSALYFTNLLRALEMAQSYSPLESIPRTEINAYRETMDHFDLLQGILSSGSSVAAVSEFVAAKKAWRKVFEAWSKAAEFISDA